ncbi:CDP-alcohol phosphatidyltransferase family protein [Allohahella marinimesophila]|uniref:CDP-diacylglycerol--glycerol-3-phosphate 3-phosphatidyltransferase n=1 Tax=Allohahella marinimesophila TaxID=1054972 RepID=A0ABP7P3Z2_9GAMM
MSSSVKSRSRATRRSPLDKLSWLPNAITVLRIVLVAPIAWLLLQQDYGFALLLFLAAGLSDGIDGFLARRYDWGSRFGAIADPLADKLLMVVTFAMLSLNGVVHWWLTIIVYGRDIILVSGALAYHYIVGQYEIQPSWLGKLTTFTQILFLLLVLVVVAAHQQLAPSFGVQYPELPFSHDIARLFSDSQRLDDIVSVSHWIAAAVTVASGLHYVMLWGGRFIFERSRMKGQG